MGRIKMMFILMCVFGWHTLISLCFQDVYSKFATYSSVHITYNYTIMLCVSCSDYQHTFCVKEARSVYGDSITRRQYLFLSLSTYIIS